LPKRRAKESFAEHIPTMLDVCIYTPWSMKSFHGVSAGNVHKCLPKTSIGKVRTFVFLHGFDRCPTDRCFLYAGYGNPCYWAILRRLSSTSQSRAAPCAGALRRGALGGSGGHAPEALAQQCRVHFLSAISGWPVELRRAATGATGPAAWGPARREESPLKG